MVNFFFEPHFVGLKAMGGGGAIKKTPHLIFFYLIGEKTGIFWVFF